LRSAIGGFYGFKRKAEMMIKKSLAALVALFLTCSAAASSPAVQSTAGLFKQPFLITSAGQNAEVQIAAVLAKRAALDYTLVKLAGPADLNGMKTLVLVLGASLKGLGAAGLDMDKERNRVAALVTAAGKSNIPILCLHLGGESRRGQQTDDLIREFLPLARIALVVKSGNADGIFTAICRANNIPLLEVEKTVDALDPLRKAFQ
jgi:hypothetical protein